MGAAPLGVVTRRWRPLVVRPADGVDRKAYTFCVLDRLRKDLRRRDVFVSPSHRWADPRAKLLHGPAWESMRPAVCHDLGLPLTPEDQLARLARQLEAAYKRSARNLPDNTALRIEPVNGRDEPVLTPLDKLEEPPSLIEIRSRVAELVPEVDLPELLLEVNSWTGFADEFTHLGEDSAWIENLPTSVCAVLMAEACNIGFKPIARRDVPALRTDRLRWVQQHYVRADTITSANARLVDEQASIPLAQLWGGGEAGVGGWAALRRARANDQRRSEPEVLREWARRDVLQLHQRPVHRFPRRRRPRHAARLAVHPGRTARAPDQPATDGADVRHGRLQRRRLRVVLAAGLPVQPAAGRPGRPAVLAHGFDRRLRCAAATLARHPIRPQLIADHWDDLLRVAGSLRLGTVRASELMRTLQRGGHVSTLATAIGELGRIAKTLYLLAYIDDESYRRRILNQINRGEGRHAVARAVFFGKKGELRKKYREGQEDQLGALGLVVNMIVLWNTLYMSRALDHLRASAYAVRDEDAARLSPLIHDHINMLGSYRFALPEPLAAGQFRPLRDPDRSA